MSRPDKVRKGKVRKGRRADGPKASPRMSVAAHPRARRQVRQVKGWTGLACFVIAVALSVQAQVPVSDVIERGLFAGIAGYLTGWGCALAVWRSLLTAELRAQAEAVRARRAEAAAAAEATPARG